MIKKFFFTLCLFIFSILLFPSAKAESTFDSALPHTLTINSAIQQLLVERERDNIAKNRLQELILKKQQQIQTLHAKNIEQTVLNRADLDIAIAQADLNAITLTLDDIEQSIDYLKRNILDLENQLQDINIANNSSNKSQALEIQKSLNQERALFKIQQTRIKNLYSMQNRIKQELEILQEWRNRLQLLYQTYQNEKRKLSLEQLALSLQAMQQKSLKKLAILNQQLKVLEEQGLTDTPAYSNLTVKILDTEEKTNLNHLELVSARLANQLESINILIQHDHSITDWNTAETEIESISESLRKASELIQGKIILIQQHQQIGSKGKENGIINTKELNANLKILQNLLYNYEKRKTLIDNLSKQAESYKKIINKKLRRALAKRQVLPGLNLQEWLILGQKIGQFPTVILQTLKATVHQLWSGIKELKMPYLCGWLLLEIMWLSVMAWFFPRLKKLVTYYHDDVHGSSANTIYVILELIRRNFIGITFGTGLTILFYASHVSNKIFMVFFYLAIVWFSFNGLNEIIKISIFENIENATKRNIKFYQRLKRFVILGGILTSFIVLARQLPISYEVEDSFNRLFMLFLLIISIVLFKGKYIVTHLLKPYTQNVPQYFKKIIRLLNILFPIILSTTAIVGLIGYIELAWTIFHYAGKFLLLLIFYLIIKGTLREIIIRISKALIRNSRNGWLWSEAFLKPLDKIVKIAVFIFTTYLFFLLCDLNQYSFIVIKFNEILRAKLFSLAGGDINLLTLLELFIVLSIIIWLAKWTPEFAHRWLFAHIKDIGLRNSSAIFTQYTLVSIGILVCLKIIGINLFALTAVAGAFAFGVGLGLRDLANNFACGILLLIERPLRKGDLVTIGNYEGEVTHIGMRSITVYTGDLTEAVVPNSEAFSKTFVNWTLCHHIVRGVITLRISPNDNPHIVQDGIVKIIKEIPGVVSNPAPEVFFREINEGFLDFEARYYINLKVTISRAEMRSKILFAIWDCCKNLGIKIAPHPEQDIHIKSYPIGPTIPQ